MRNVERGWEAVRRFGSKLGPYLMLEILLPGGTLFALLLFVYRRSRLNGRAAPPWMRAIVAWVPMLAPQPAYVRTSAGASFDAAKRTNPNSANR